MGRTIFYSIGFGGEGDIKQKKNISKKVKWKIYIFLKTGIRNIKTLLTSFGFGVSILK